MAFKKVETPTDSNQHVHLWYQSGNLSEQRCRSLINGRPCGVIGVSNLEYQRRVDEWENYYELVRTTPAFLDYQAMSEAIKKRDFGTVREIQARILERNTISQNQYGDPVLEPKEEGGFLPKPAYPDPVTHSWRYTIL